MKKVINRYRTKVVLDSRDVALCRGIFGRQRKFLAWNEIEAVGFYVGDMPHTDYTVNPVSLYPMYSVNVRSYSLEHILPVIKDERNICINLGGGEFTALSSINKRADKAAEKILTFYNGKILNRGAAYHR